MKKLFVLGYLLLGALCVSALPNPAALCCQKNGEDYKIVDESMGQVGYCLSEGFWVEEWSFYSLYYENQGGGHSVGKWERIRADSINVKGFYQLTPEQEEANRLAAFTRDGIRQWLSNWHLKWTTN